MRERHRDDKDIVQQLKELGMPVLTVESLANDMAQSIELEKAHYRGMLAMCRYLISYGCTPERVVEAHTEIEKKLLGR
jgi:hypothetical protein